jgi:hypothetical protein
VVSARLAAPDKQGKLHVFFAIAHCCSKLFIALQIVISCDHLPFGATAPSFCVMNL